MISCLGISVCIYFLVAATECGFPARARISTIFPTHIAMSLLTSSNKPVPLKALDRKIAELREKSLLPAELVNLVSEVARIQLAAESSVRFEDAEPSCLPAGLADLKSKPGQHSQGAPILPAASFPLDMPLAERLIPRVLRILEEQTPALAPVVQDIQALVTAEPQILKEGCREVLRAAQTGLKAKENCFAVWEKQHPESPNTLFFIMRSAVMPSLTVAGRLLGKEHNHEHAWEQGHCPVCGSPPLMGRLVGTEGARMHTCSFCAFEYRVPRMACPFCSATRGEGAEYLTSEEEPGYLLEICRDCKTCFKLADFREVDRPYIASLDDLSSLMLDMHARQMMFDRPVPSAWGF